MSDRPYGRRILACVICGARVSARSLSGPSGSGEDMIEVPFGWWIGITQERAELVATCSPRCTQVLLRA